MKVGICGQGVVGGALERWLRKQTSHRIVIYDGPKGIEEDFTGVDAIFLCVPVPTQPSRLQDTSALRSCIERYKALGAPFIVRSTVLPGTCDDLARMHNVTVYAMPEFLTERQADYDTEIHDIVCGPVPEEMRHHLFGFKKVFRVMTNVEAELAKYAHNCFAAVKVNYFNIIHALAQHYGADYERVLCGAMVTKFIEPTHTRVPGPDGKLGYGGKCLPKDLRAFIGLLLRVDLDPIHMTSLYGTEAENQAFRNATAE